MMKDALRLVRVYHDMNQSDTAERVGLSKSYISEMEKGRKKVTIDVLEKYSEAFDVPVSSLMLFAERQSENNLADDTRVYVAEKAIKMLDWLATITNNRESEKRA